MYTLALTFLSNVSVLVIYGDISLVRRQQDASSGIKHMLQLVVWTMSYTLALPMTRVDGQT